MIVAHELLKILKGGYELMLRESQERPSLVVMLISRNAGPNNETVTSSFEIGIPYLTFAQDPSGVLLHNLHLARASLLKDLHESKERAKKEQKERQEDAAVTYDPNCTYDIGYPRLADTSQDLPEDDGDGAVH